MIFNENVQNYCNNIGIKSIYKLFLMGKQQQSTSAYIFPMKKIRKYHMHTIFNVCVWILECDIIKL